VEKPKPVHLETPLVVEGKAAAMILCPDGEQWRVAAGELAGMLKERLGVELPVRSASEVKDEELRGTQVVALGAVSNNPRLLYLYSHAYTYADDFYPGAGGFVLQSIHDPWGTGKNVVLVGASTVEGEKAAFGALMTSVPESGVVGPLFEAQLTGEARAVCQSTLEREPDEAYQKQQREAGENALKTGAHTGLFGQMASIGSLYAQTHKGGYAVLFAWLARRAKEHRDSNPGTFGGPWGMDSDFQIYKVMPLWDQVEESPALSDQDRLDVTRILFEWVSETAVGEAGATVGSTHVRHNHQTFPALGLMFTGDYFDKYYGAIEGKRWLDIADACFQFQMKAYKPHEDCNGYQWLTLYHTMLYSLARPDFTYFENGNARRDADFAILCMDNLGYQVTYGDTGAYTGWWSELPFLRGAAWYYRDGRYSWAISKKVAVSGRNAVGEFGTDLLPQEPDDLSGAIAWELDPLWFESQGGPAAIPQERAVDKVVFRNGFDPADEYLLLDGLSNGGHKHLDGNSISRWSENGRIWLADADYMLALPKYHNGVLIFRDGQSAEIPGFVEIEHMVDLPHFGASTTTYRNYAGADWRRSVVWIKGTGFVVVDEMTATANGDYSFRLVWNTIGEAKLTENGLSVEQDGQFAEIVVPPDCRLSLKDDPEYGKNWAGYKYIKEPVVREFQAIRDARLKAGERVVLVSLLHATGEQPGTARMTRTSDDSVVIDGLAEPVQVAAGDAHWQLRRGSAPGAADEETVFEARGELCAVTPERVLVVGATEAQGMGPKLEEGATADLEYCMAEGSGTRTEPARTTAANTAGQEKVAGNRLDPAVMWEAIRAAVARAPQVARAKVSAVEMPAQLRLLWDYREKLDAYLLTDNVGAFEGVDAGVKVTVSPEPLAVNIFNGSPGENDLAGLADGELLTTGGGVMWADDQVVTVNLDFDDSYDLSKLVVREWFATSSSKGKLFQLGKVVVEASSGGFAEDVRKVAEYSDAASYGNWGAPKYGPHSYEIDLKGAKARSLRLRLEPRPGTAIYLAELEVWGNKPGLELDSVRLKARSVPVHTFTPCLADLEGDGVGEVIVGSTNGKVCARDSGGTKLWVTTHLVATGAEGAARGERLG